ncbi:MAG: CoA-binding protein [Halodesulfurarchaeum sp.]
MPAESDDELRSILEYETIAVVGCSTTPGKPAHDVPAYLDRNGYHVIPVNPFADEILGHEAYDSLAEVDERVDVVDVFRPSDEVPGIVEEALERDDVRVVWLQEGIVHDETGLDVEADGRQFVQNHCMKIEHRRLV